MIPLPTFTATELATARKRSFEFGRSGGTDASPWTIKTDGGQGLGMNPHRASAAPAVNAFEIWHLETEDEWSHPVHIHFEEGIILKRDGVTPPPWEKWARKDVYRIGTLLGTQPEVGRHRRRGDSLPRFRRHVLGALPQHAARGPFDDAALGHPQSRTNGGRPHADIDMGRRLLRTVVRLDKRQRSGG